MKNTFSKIRKFMAKNIKYTSLIYLNNTYCMNNNLNNTYCIKGKNCSYTDRGCIYNNNQQYLYHVNNTQPNINYLNNNNLQYQYYGNYSNSNSIQQNIGYSNYDNQQYTYYGNYSNPNFTQQNIGYSSYDNQQYQYYGNYSNHNFTQQNINYNGNFGNNNNNTNFIQSNRGNNINFGNYSNPNSIQQNICHNGNSAFAPYIVNNNTNKKNTNVNNINDYNKAQIIDIKNKIIINGNEKNSQKEHINEEILQKKHRNDKKRKFNRIGRFRKENKKKCAEDFRKWNLTNRIFTASLRLVQCKANELLKKAKANELLENAKANELLENAKIKELSTNTKIKELSTNTKIKELSTNTKLKELFKNAKLKNKQFTKIHTFHEVPNKYKCIEELFSKNIEEILTKNSIRCKSKNNNAVIIEIINKLDDQNNGDLLLLKNFLKTKYEDFFKNINGENLAKYDESFRIFYDVYKTDEKNKKKIEDYINNFVDNVNSTKTRNRKK